jgi:[ribosomal protein S18]-alanine N-acetyltransferase
MSPAYATRAYQPADYARLADLLDASGEKYTSFDWFDLPAWLDQPATLVRLAEDNDRLVGVIGTSPPQEGVTWLRLVACAQGYDSGALFSGLLRDALAQLDPAVHQVHVFLTSPWMITTLADQGFAPWEDVITLVRGEATPPAAQASAITTRHVEVDDIQALVAIDHAAFDPPWRMSYTEMLRAHRLAVAHTMAVRDGVPVGYQATTRHGPAAHLARLAVLPECQGHGIGSALVGDLIERLARQQIKRVTVNTQASNLASQAVYARFAFVRTGFDMPVWRMSTRQDGDKGQI